jgi:hypothetical protein
MKLEIKNLEESIAKSVRDEDMNYMIDIAIAQEKEAFEKMQECMSEENVWLHTEAAKLVRALLYEKTARLKGDNNE